MCVFVYVGEALMQVPASVLSNIKCTHTSIHFVIYNICIYGTYVH